MFGCKFKDDVYLMKRDRCLARNVPSVHSPTCISQQQPFISMVPAGSPPVNAAGHMFLLWPRLDKPNPQVSQEV